MDYPVWLWRPDSGMTESLEWLTDIIESYDGAEQRIRVRQAPRQSFEVSSLLKDPIHASRVRVAIAAWQHKPCSWPCWQEEVRLSSLVSSGSSSINIDTTTGDWREGGKALVLESPSKYQIFDILSITETNLGFSAPFSSTYAAGSYVFPLRVARLSAQIGRQDYVGNELEYSMSVRVLDNAEIPSAPSAVQYLGYDVLSDRLLLDGSTVKREISRPFDVLDPGMGDWSVFARTAFPSISTEHRWNLKTPSQCWAFRKWLHRRAGALCPVWIPSHSNDLVLAETPNSSTTVLKVYDTNYRNAGLNNIGMSHIAVFFPSGAFVCRQITNAVAGAAGQENLTINSSLGASGAFRVSFLSLNRFMGDKISIKWEGVGQGVCSSSMVSVSV